MTDEKRGRDDDMEQRVRQASPGEPEAGVRAESTDRQDRRDTSTSQPDAPDSPDTEREEDTGAVTERIERMQREGKGMGGTSTQGRTDVVDEEAVEKATRGEED